MNELGSLLSNRWTLLLSNILVCALYYIRRQVNRVAPNLVIASILHVNPSTFYHLPYYIHSIILIEMK